MGTSSTAAAPSSQSRLLRWGGVLLLGLGLLGHLYAAHAMGGSRVAYTHHVLGFGLILLVTGGLIAGLGYRFWRSRSALTLLAIGVVQALLGLWVALEPFRAAPGS
jgi:uncharacterized membrane protein HdeD (DUF308 family)